MAYIDTKYIGDCKTCLHHLEGLGCGTYCDHGESYRPNMSKIPTADVVEVRHGEWIWTENGEEDYEQYWVCSVCGEKSYIETKFCSDCGAKMDGKLKLNLPEHIRKAVELRHKGYDIKAIAKELGYCERQIYRFLKEARKDEGGKKQDENNQKKNVC